MAGGGAWIRWCRARRRYNQSTRFVKASATEGAKARMCPTSVTQAIPPPTRVSAINIAYRTRSGRRGSSTPAVSAQTSPAPLPRRTPPPPCQRLPPNGTPHAFRLSRREVAPNGPKQGGSIRADPPCRARHWRAVAAATLGAGGARSVAAAGPVGLLSARRGAADHAATGDRQWSGRLDTALLTGGHTDNETRPQLGRRAGHG